MQNTKMLNHTSNRAPKEILVQRRELLNEILDIFDKNKNGKLKSSDLQSILITMGRSPSQNEINELLQKLDKDNQGTVDRNELLVAIGEKYTLSETKVQEVLSAFKVFDIKNRGVIPVSEFKNILMNIGNDFKEEEIEEIITMIGVNKDKVLDYKEFVNAWKYQ